MSQLRTFLCIPLFVACSGKVFVLPDDDTADTASNEPDVTADTAQPVDEPDPDPYDTWLIVEDLPGGTFDMGCTRPTEWPCTDDERPSHTVTLDPFISMKTEVPRGMYRSVMGTAERPPGCTQDDCALVGVTWFDAVTFCNRVSELQGLTAPYTISGTTVTWDANANGWRLPTEAEWEYAARGNRDLMYAGSSDLEQVAWTEGDSGGRPHVVGEKAPNDYNLVDMSGNAWEWVWDRKDDYSSEASTNPTGPSTGSTRVIRGGSWNDVGERARISARDERAPEHQDTTLGFRMVRSSR